MSSLVNTMYWLWEGALSKEFCDYAIAQTDWEKATEGRINSDDIVDLGYRKTDIVWQTPMEPLGCVSRAYIDQANNSAQWHYNIAGQENTQIGRYKSTDNGFYDWHMDSFPPMDGLQRKLTCVILLNDPSEFEGGVLQFKGIEDRVILTKRGSIVVFPSFIEHRVTPVTKGNRYTAVTWAFGAAFR